MGIPIGTRQYALVITLLALLLNSHSCHSGEAREDQDCDFYSNLFGSLGGARSWLCQHGINVEAQTDDETWRNLRGGKRERTTYNGVLTINIVLDTEKLFNLKGGLFNVSWMNIRGRSISYSQLADYNTISTWEAYTSNRLFELWYQQSFLSELMDIKIGQQALDSEFIVSDMASLYLNSNFSWPMGPSSNLYSSGGPSSPLAALGVRFRYRPSEQTTLMFAVTNDNPTGHSFYNEKDPSNQSVHPHGDNFNLKTGALLIGELQHSIDLLTEREEGLPGTYKLGGMYDTAYFPDQRWDKTGRKLADPQSSGDPAYHQGNWILYAVADQTLWRSSVDTARTLGVFGRVTKNRSDRNVIDWGVDAGFNLTAPLPGRDEDSFGVAWGMGHTGRRARRADRDVQQLSGSYYPIRKTEHHMEITYRAQLAPWLSIQPDIQYIWNPGGGVLKENTDRRMHNEFIVGMHSQVVF
ncbi:carbohydrate porin [Azomonas macrocytogenes]|uniref:Porin n=1 Tax=Azomonas macrocytogenes TaxID=69962 RepID=A0A839SZK7_AZOMA|nr:carbohydrate porin [Azomonas macrocytogenes]MBB3102582.1 porin [Azomonas macrocytogenes]